MLIMLKTPFWVSISGTMPPRWWRGGISSPPPAVTNDREFFCTGVGLMLRKPCFVKLWQGRELRVACSSELIGTDLPLTIPIVFHAGGVVTVEFQNRHWWKNAASLVLKGWIEVPAPPDYVPPVDDDEDADVD